MIRVYPSSKVRHAHMWRRLQEDIPHVFFNARWIKRAEKESDLQGDDFRDLWSECKEDVMDSDALLVYAEDGDHLKGALVEVGMAIANDIRVVLVTTDENRLAYGTWIHADNVEWVTTLEEAMSLLYKWTKKGVREEKSRFTDWLIHGDKENGSTNFG